ncbi:MAG: L,D-transpeptidase [Rhodobacter sp.]|nr:L,D-transpeptidase [Rhodobacter sp.]
MLTRRHFISTAGAVAAFSALPRTAQAAYTIPPEHMPQIVSIGKQYAPGEIHVDPNRFYLYWTQEKRKAIRYVVGVGKRGLYESGEFFVGEKKEWPSWRPTDDMIKRSPEQYERYADGVPGGPGNPLGARALYLHTADGVDSALRIHGTPQPWTLGQAVSNGCARLANSHIIHLYERVPLGSRVVLYPQA